MTSFKPGIISIGVASALMLSSMIPLSAAPASPQARQALNAGIQNYRIGYIQKALPFFQKAVQLSPQNDEVQLWYAKALLKQGGEENQERARRALRLAIQYNNDNVEALGILGELTSWDSNTHNESMLVLKRALSLGTAKTLPLKRRNELTRMLVDLLSWNNHPVEALKYSHEISKAYANDPDWVATHANLLVQNGELDKAISYFETPLMTRQMAKSPGLMVDYAYVLEKAGETVRAESVYASARDAIMQSGTPGEKAKLAAIAFQIGRYNDVIEIDSALPASERTVSRRFRLARAYRKAIRVPEAIDAFQSLYDEGLLSGDEKLEYADYLNDLDLPADALARPDLIEALYIDAADEVSNPGPINLRLARLYVRQGERFDDAVNAFRQAMKYPDTAPEARKELVDYLKSAQANPDGVDKTFKALLLDDPTNYDLKGAYAEFLSWQEHRRPEAMEAYLELTQVDASRESLWHEKLEEVLEWHNPREDLIPLYNKILSRYPNSRTAQLSLARTYAQDSDTISKSVDLYTRLKRQYPDDAQIKKEWVRVLLADEDFRDEATRIIQDEIAKNPNDVDLLISYGQILSYKRKYADAIEMYESALEVDPENRDALTGKGLALLWDGQKITARKLMMRVVKNNPQYPPALLGLAEVEMTFKHYDLALQLVNEAKRILERQKFDIEGYNVEPVTPDTMTILLGLFPSTAVEDTDLIAYDGNGQTYDSNPWKGMQPKVQYTPEPLNAPGADDLQKDLDDLKRVMELLDSETQEATQDIQSMKTTISTTKQAIPGVIRVVEEEEGDPINYGLLSTYGGTYDEAADSGYIYGNGGGSGDTLYERFMPQRMGQQFVSVELISNRGTLTDVRSTMYQNLSETEAKIHEELRPVIRSGFGFFHQKGERQTTALRNWAFSNQLDMAFTPRSRLRLGYSRRRFAQPRSNLTPHKTMASEYSVGGNIVLGHRTTLDGDIALTDFAQSDTTSLTYQASLNYDINDQLRVKIGSRRLPLENSLLSMSGIRADHGFYRGRLVGQARETSFFFELAGRPTRNIDMSGVYEFAFVDGKRIPSNFKNQFFGTVGYTKFFGDTVTARLGYEFLYFGYQRNAQNGFFDIAGFNRLPVVVIGPPAIVAHRGFVKGGYYSPEHFFLNQMRLDINGAFFNRKLEYKIGGALGVQAADNGHGIPNGDNRWALASTANARLIYNLTSWLAGFGHVDFMNSTGFTRWRFGGGVMLRPEIDMLMPLFPVPSTTKKPAILSEK